MKPDMQKSILQTALEAEITAGEGFIAPLQKNSPAGLQRPPGGGIGT